MAKTAAPPNPPRTFKLPGLPGHPIPYYDVDLLVHIVDSIRLSGGCKVPKKIQAFHDTWITRSLPSLVHWGTLHYHGVDIVQGNIESAYESRMRKCWQTLVDFRPEVVAVNGQNRLVFASQGNPDEQGGLSEVVGEAVGVAIVAKMLKVNKSAFKRLHFSPTTRHDYNITVGKRTVWLETRGRFNGNNKAEAMRQVDDKFNRQVNSSSKTVGGKTKWTFTTTGSGDFDQAIGALVYPSDNPNRKDPDIEIMDPPSRSSPLSDVERARRLLQHYLEIFRRQDLRVVAHINQLIALPDIDLDALLERGDSTFTSAANYPPRRLVFFGRIRLSVQGQDFWGTYFGADAPTWVRQPQLRRKDGVFFYGIWRSVIEMLGSYRILELLDSSTDAQVTQMESGTTFVLFEDGVLTAWSPSIETLRSDAKQVAK